MNSILSLLEFHHIGLATRNSDVSRKFLSSIGYSFNPERENPANNVMIQFCEHPVFPRIELVYKFNTEASSIDNILKKELSHMYHICYKCKDVDEVIKSIKEQGFGIYKVSGKKGNPFSFYFIKDYGLIEFYENDDESLL